MKKPESELKPQLPLQGPTMEVSELFQEIGRMHAEKMLMDKVIVAQQKTIADLQAQLEGKKEPPKNPTEK